MKTVFELSHWAPDALTRDDEVPQFDTAAAAAAAAGFNGLSDWLAASFSGEPGYRYPMERSATAERWLIRSQRTPETDADRTELALELLLNFGQTDGDHHKLWVIDQVVRLLAGDRYEAMVTEYRDGEDGPDTYEWDTGIAP